MNYKIITDSNCNLPSDIALEKDIEIIPIEYICDGNVYLSTQKEDFYQKLIMGKKITTSCINEQTFTQVFEKHCKQNQDFIYISFSSKLSQTYSIAKKVVDTLSKKYPRIKMIAVDSLCMSLGLGLLCFNACEVRDSGKSIFEVENYVLTNRLKINHLFTVDDLKYLYKGGRLSKSAYFFGGVMKIKPLLRVDENGGLVSYGKVFGRKKSISSLVDKMVEKIEKPSDQTICISHGYCPEEAQELLNQIKKRIQFKNVIINELDPVIVSHSGIGTLAVYFMSQNRDVFTPTSKLPIRNMVEVK